MQATPQSGALGGIIEVHIDAPDGKLIGQTAMIESKPVDFVRIMENLGMGAPKPGVALKNKTDKDKKAAPKQGGFDFSMLRTLMSTKADATLNTVDGMHTIYFVFKNSKAKPNQVLMQVVEIHFQDMLPVAAKK